MLLSGCRTGGGGYPSAEKMCCIALNRLKNAYNRIDKIQFTKMEFTILHNSKADKFASLTTSFDESKMGKVVD